MTVKELKTNNMAETKKYSTIEEAPPTYGFTKTSKKLKPIKKGASVNDFDDTVAKYRSPAKDMKTGEYKHSFEGGYIPYKMLGHELPGPNQRTPAVLKAFDASGGAINEEMVDGISTTPGVPYKGGVGSSPAKNIFKKFREAFGGGEEDTSKAQAVQAVEAAKLKEQQIGAQAGGAGAAGGITGDPMLGGGGGADHTHPEFAQLDEAMQGGGGMQVQTGELSGKRNISKVGTFSPSFG
jgi:hypothetical protein